MDKEEKLRESLELRLKDFSPDDEANEHWSDLNAGKPATLKPKSKPVPYIVFIIFVYLKKFSFGGRWEKVAWEIPIKYKGVPMMLAHKKFGFMILTYTGSKKDKKLAQEAIYKINKAIPVAEQLIEPAIKEQVDAGAITLSNEYHSLRARYEYFREEAERHLSATDKQKFDIHGFDDHIQAYNALLKSQNKASNYAIAMLDAYFSLLEHILVMVKPFVTLNEKESNLSEFIGLNWGEKYKNRFDVTAGGIEKNRFDDFYNIKEIYRNPLSHGNFQKGGASLNVHMPNVGAIPMLLTKADSEVHFSFRKLDEPKFNEICKVFDEFDIYLESGRTKYGMIYLKSGTDVVFDMETKKLYSEAMESEEFFIQFVDQMGQRFQGATNMDW